MYGAEYVTVPSDEDGHQHRLPGSRPSGRPQVYLRAFQLPKPHRRNHFTRTPQRLVELADRYGVPIIEDDPYGQLRFEGDHIPLHRGDG
jgi:2-aminoadipate transaminase